MNEITRVGVDLAKRVIQVHAVDTAGRVVAAKALPPDKFAAWCVQLPAGCVIAMEACSGAHHWARKLRSFGLDARLIAGHFVTPYRMAGKAGKNDAADAAAICEAASRPQMRFVPVKTPAQQALLAKGRTGRQQISSTNWLSRHMWRRRYPNGALLSGWYLGPHRNPSATRPSVDVQSVLCGSASHPELCLQNNKRKCVSREEIENLLIYPEVPVEGLGRFELASAQRT